MASERLHLELCNLTLKQYPDIKVLMDEAYPELGGSWPKHTIKRLIEEFPATRAAEVARRFWLPRPW